MPWNPSALLFEQESDAAIASRAAELSYASLRFEFAGVRGLTVLSEIADKGNLTFWQATGLQTMVLDRGYLDHTVGFPADLLSTRFILDGQDSGQRPWHDLQDSSARFEMVRRWQTSTGEIRMDRARGSLECTTDAITRELPLATIELLECSERLEWSTGEVTESELWISPDTGRIWAMEAEPWPGSRVIKWQVARPWW